MIKGVRGGWFGGSNFVYQMNFESEPNHTKEHGLETLALSRAIVFVPGLGESATEIYRDIGQIVGIKDSIHFFSVSTHADKESERQHYISKEISVKKDQSNLVSEKSPLMCIVSDEERDPHTSFENRVRLTTTAIKEAKESNAEEIVLVGHSAGGLAVLSALAREVETRKSNTVESSLPPIHAVLIAPAIPGDVKKWITVEPTFLKVMIRDMVTSIWRNNPSYIGQLLRGQDIVPSDEDLAEILGPTEDRDFEQNIVKGAVPISGAEGLELLQYPKVLGDLKPEDWPENFRIDVVIPQNDQWISKEGQYKLATEVLHALTGGKTATTFVPGGHLPLGAKEQASKIIADIITGN
jgi:predicted alpha/beta hydrolase family esterase